MPRFLITLKKLSYFISHAVFAQFSLNRFGMHSHWVPPHFSLEFDFMKYCVHEKKYTILSPFVYDFCLYSICFFCKITKFTTKPEKFVLHSFLHSPPGVSHSLALFLSISITYGLMSHWQFPSKLQGKNYSHHFIQMK